MGHDKLLRTDLRQGEVAAGGVALARHNGKHSFTALINEEEG